MEVTQRFQMILHGKVRAVSKKKSGIGYLLCIILFLASYSFILQPWGSPPDVDEDVLGIATIEIIESGYIICESDGTLKFYLNDDYLFTISDAARNIPPFNELPIIYK